MSNKPVVILRYAPEHGDEKLTGTWISATVPNHVIGRTCDLAIWMREPDREAEELRRAVKACLKTADGVERHISDFGFQAPFHTKTVMQSRAVVPIYHEDHRNEEGLLVPVECVPDIKARLTCLLDGTFSLANPKREELYRKMCELATLFEEAEKAEAGPLVWPEGSGLYCVNELVPNTSVPTLPHDVERYSNGDLRCKRCGGLWVYGPAPGPNASCQGEEK